MLSSGHVPDKELMAEIGWNLESSGMELYDEEYGYYSPGTLGKRGSKRGPKGPRSR